jgi:hypothetical protein
MFIVNFDTVNADSPSMKAPPITIIPRKTREVLLPERIAHNEAVKLYRRSRKEY